SNRAPCAASRSRLGVGTRPPVAPRASARHVSIVTSSTFRSLLTLRVKAGVRSHHHAPNARAAAPTPRNKRIVHRPRAGGGAVPGAGRAVRALAIIVLQETRESLSAQPDTELAARSRRIVAHTSPRPPCFRPRRARATGCRARRTPSRRAR